MKKIFIMNDRDIGMSPEPPDEPLPEYLECILCEDSHSEEDIRQVHEKNICIWCVGAAAKEDGRIRFSKLFDQFLKEWATERPWSEYQAILSWADFRKWLKEKEL